MREQNILAEAVSAARDDRVNRNAGEGLAQLERVASHLERHQPRLGLDHFEAEPARRVIGETRCPQFRNREAAGREHYRRRNKAAAVALDPKSICASYFGDV